MAKTQLLSAIGTLRLQILLQLTFNNIRLSAFNKQANSYQIRVADHAIRRKPPGPAFGAWRAYRANESPRDHLTYCKIHTEANNQFTVQEHILILIGNLIIINLEKAVEAYCASQMH